MPDRIQVILDILAEAKVSPAFQEASAHLEALKKRYHELSQEINKWKTAAVAQSRLVGKEITKYSRETAIKERQAVFWRKLTAEEYYAAVERYEAEQMRMRMQSLIAVQNYMAQIKASQLGFLEVMGASITQLRAIDIAGRGMLTTGGRLAMMIRKATHGLKGFKMEMLAVMFFGMNLANQWGKWGQQAFKLAGITEYLNTVLELAAFDVIEPHIDTMYNMIDAIDTTKIEFFGMSISVKDVIGTFTVLSSVLGPVLFTIGSLALGLGGIIQLLGPASIGFIRLFRGIVGMIPGAGKLLAPLFTALETAAVTKTISKYIPKEEVGQVAFPSSAAAAGAGAAAASKWAEAFKRGLAAFFAGWTTHEIANLFGANFASAIAPIGSSAAVLLTSSFSAGLAAGLPPIVTNLFGKIFKMGDVETLIGTAFSTLAMVGALAFGITLSTALPIATIIGIGSILTTKTYEELTKGLITHMERTGSEVSWEFRKGFEEKISKFPPEFQKKFREDLERARVNLNLRGMGYDMAGDLFSMSAWAGPAHNLDLNLSNLSRDIGRDLNVSMSRGIEATSSVPVRSTRGILHDIIRDMNSSKTQSSIAGKSVSTAFGQGIASQAYIPVNTTKAVTSQIKSEFKSVPESINMDMRKGTIKSALDEGLVKPVINSYNTTISFLYSLVDWFKWASREISAYSARMFSGGYFTAMFTPWWARPPGMQYGGIVKKPTLVMAGERGPEAIVPLNRGNYPSISYSPNITVNATVSSEIDIRNLANRIAFYLGEDYRRLTRSSYRVG